MNFKIPEDWKIWAEENIQNGSDPEELIDDMPNINTIHQGKPVLHGHKSIITKWFREKRSGST